MQEKKIFPLLGDVSVVIPAYNAENFIIDALRSVARQTSLPKEVIVINDGSSDRTYQTVQEWITRKQHNYPIHLYTQDNRGISATRNVGIQRSASEWVAFLDADDIWEPSHLEELMTATKLVPSAIAAYGAGRLLENGVLQGLLYDDFWDNPSRKFGKQIDSSPYFRISSTIFPRLIRGNFIKPSSLMVSRILANEIGLFNIDLSTGEDREFLVRLIRRGEFIYCSLPITQYRWHNNNASQNKNLKRNAGNGLRALKLIIENKELDLTGEEAAACRKEVNDAIKEFLYICSQEGLKEYLKGLGFVEQMFGPSSVLTALNLKHMARSIVAGYSSLRSQANPR